MKRIISLIKNPKEGFTIIEILVTMVIVSVCAFFLFTTLYDMLSSSSFENERLKAMHDRQSALATIESDALLASRFLSTLDTNLSDTYPPTSNGGIWLYKGESATSRYLLLRAYSTTGNPLSNSRQPVFIGSGTNCDADHIYFNTVQRYNIVYFVKDGDLYRRRIADTATPTCSVQYQKTSCPALMNPDASHTAPCSADDEKLLTNVSNFSVQYYDTKTSSTALNVYDSGADPSLVTTAVDIEVTLGVSERVSGKTFTTQSTLRMTKLNMGQ